MKVSRSVLIILSLLTFSATALAQEPKPEAAPPREYSELEINQLFDKILSARLDDEDICLSFRATRVLVALVRNGAKELVATKQSSRLPEAEQNLNSFLDELLARAKTRTNEPRIKSKDITGLLGNRFGTGANPTSRGLCPLFPFC